MFVGFSAFLGYQIAAEINKNQQKVEELERKVNELIAAQGGASMDPPAVTSSLVSSLPRVINERTL